MLCHGVQVHEEILMRFFEQKGAGMLVWSGMSLFFICAIAGMALAAPGETESTHAIIAQAIRDHITIGPHNGSLTRTDAVLWFSCIQGIVLSLVGVIYRSVGLRVTLQDEALIKIRDDLSDLQGDHREFTGRVDEKFQAQARQMQNLIDITAETNRSIMADMKKRA